MIDQAFAIIIESDFVIIHARQHNAARIKAYPSREPNGFMS